MKHVFIVNLIEDININLFLISLVQRKNKFDLIQNLELYFFKWRDYATIDGH
jgi:hypothetical protein